MLTVSGESQPRWREHDKGPEKQLAQKPGGCQMGPSGNQEQERDRLEKGSWGQVVEGV